MQDLTFGEQVKIILSRKDMTIKELAKKVEARTGRKMSRQNLTQRLGRDNFQERDMRMIAEILGCPFQLNILDERTITENETKIESAGAAPREPKNNLVAEKKAAENNLVAGKKAAENNPEAENNLVAENKPIKSMPDKEAGSRVHERDITIGELVDIHEELDALMEKAAEPEDKPKENDKEVGAAQVGEAYGEFGKEHTNGQRTDGHEAGSGAGDGKEQRDEQDFHKDQAKEKQAGNVQSRPEGNLQSNTEAQAGKASKGGTEAQPEGDTKREHAAQAGEVSKEGAEAQAGETSKGGTEAQHGGTPKGGTEENPADNSKRDSAARSGRAPRGGIAANSAESPKRGNAAYPGGISKGGAADRFEEFLPGRPPGGSGERPQGSMTGPADENGQEFSGYPAGYPKEYGVGIQQASAEAYGEAGYIEDDAAAYPMAYEEGADGEHVEQLLKEIESLEKTEKKETVQEEKPHGWRAYLMQRLKKLGREQTRTEKTVSSADEKHNQAGVRRHGETGAAEAAGGQPAGSYPEAGYTGGTYSGEHYPDQNALDGMYTGGEYEGADTREGYEGAYTGGEYEGAYTGGIYGENYTGGEYPGNEYGRRHFSGEYPVESYGEEVGDRQYPARAYVGGYSETEYTGGAYEGEYLSAGYSEDIYQEEPQQEDEEDRGEVNPYTGKEYESNSVRMHPSRIGYVQVYDRANHEWTDMTEWAFLGYQERKKQLLGKDYDPPIYLD